MDEQDGEPKNSKIKRTLQVFPIISVMRTSSIPKRGSA